jgi:Cft2 family RNA processing exonuclease
MYDAFLSRQNSQDFDVFTLDDVDLAFDHFIQLKYSQHYLLSGTFFYLFSLTTFNWILFIDFTICVVEWKGKVQELK